MKKALFCLSTASLLFLMIGNVSAQVVLPEVTITSTRSIPQKVDEAFKTSFENAEDPVWYQENKDYLVKFLDKDMKNNALFKKNGQLVYTISYGFEKDIPENVHNLVSNRYKDFNVVIAFNVKQDQRNIWIVNLEDEKTLVTARVEDGVLDEARRIKKANK